MLPSITLVPGSQGTGRIIIMGEVIRKDAAADHIAADGTTTLISASAKGGAWKQIADERLGPAITLFNKVVADLNQAESDLAPLQAAVTAYDHEADDFLGAKSDEMWNLVGRPAFDAAYSLAWPGGASTYADGPDDEQPERMDLLAEVLTANLHPKIDPAWSSALAAEVRSRAATYRSILDAARPARAKVNLLKRMKGIVARSVQMELSRLKRRYLAEGFREPEIHEVIPDRTRSKPAKPAEAPAKSPDASA
jgi:hypothetical protein